MATDAALPNARGLKIQLGFVIITSDRDGHSNIVHYGSSSCKQVTRSVMAAEDHALILGFYQAFVTPDLLRELIGRPIDIAAVLNSKTLFYIVAKDGTKTERRLLIAIWALRESYARGE